MNEYVKRIPFFDGIIIIIINFFNKLAFISFGTSLGIKEIDKI